MKDYSVYIMTNNSGTLYIGVTNDLERRVQEHKLGATRGFTQRYKLNRLVYYEDTNDVTAAIEREKQLKGWLRSRKLELIRSQNPTWRDLSEDWYPENAVTSSGMGEILRAAQNDNRGAGATKEPFHV